MTELLDRLAKNAPSARVTAESAWQQQALDQIAATGIAFAASDPRMEERFLAAIAELLACIKPTVDETPILNEGGIYYGCWLESTGTINTELLSRFAPGIAANTFAAFYEHIREDGCLPYKLTQDGPVWSQIQLVTPPARSLWTHAQLNDGADLMRRGYDALSRYDAWLAANRDTRGTGGVEAFCAYDTGHDLSSRFWHVLDSPRGNDPAGLHDHPTLPFIAPDLTAAVACGRRYLGRMAETLGEDPAPWTAKAEASEAALFAQCWDAEDGIFYDRDKLDRFVRIQSDVLLRVLACEIGDDAFFEAALDRYLLSTRKFFARFPFTSVALDDPRFDPHFHYNSWAGPSNFLSLIRAPHAFEAHGRHVELTWAIQPTLTALFAADRFPQCLSPYTGEAGFTECYSPSILCLLDFVERLSGIMPRPDGTIWVTGCVPTAVMHRDADHHIAYARTVDGRRFELVNAEGPSVLHADSRPLIRFPRGLRLVLTRDGTMQEVIGMTSGTVEGTIEADGGAWQVRVGPNERLTFADGEWRQVAPPILTPPST